jgi:hypothetical protein
MNGIILLKKIHFFDEAFHSQQIELFIDANYESCGIDLNELLNSTSEVYYDELFARIDTITAKIQLKRLERTRDDERERPGVLNFSKEVVKTWKSLGDFLVDVNKSSEWSAQTPIDVNVELEKVRAEVQVAPVASESVRQEVDAAGEKKDQLMEDANSDESRKDFRFVFVFLLWFTNGMFFSIRTIFGFDLVSFNIL